MAKQVGYPIWYATQINNSGLKQGEAEAQRVWQNMQRDAANAGSGVEKVWQKAGAAVGTYLSARALTDFARQVVAVRGEMQGLELAFETLLDSKEKSDKMMQDIVQFAMKTPYTVTDVASNVKQLIAMGAAGDDVMATFKTLGDVAAGVNVPISRIAINFGQVAALGKLQGREIRDFAMAGVPIVGELAKMYGVSAEEITKMVTAGKIGFPDVQKAFENMTSAGGKFNNMMEKQNSTVTGQLSRLQDQIEQMFNKIGEANEGVIYGAIDGAASLVENYEQVGKILVGLIATYGAYRTALIFTTAAEKGVTAAQLIHRNVLLVVEKAQKLLNATQLANPYVAITVAVLALATAMWVLYDGTTAVERAEKRLSEIREDFENKEQQRRGQIDGLISVLKDETQTTYAKIAAYEELQRLSPALTDAYTREELAVSKLADANKILNEEQDGRGFNNLMSNIDATKNNIDELQAKIDKLNKGGGIASIFGGSAIGALSSAGAKIWSSFTKKELDTQKALLLEYEEELENHNKRIADAEFNTKSPIERVEIRQEELDAIRAEFDKVKAVLEEEQRKLAAGKIFFIPIQIQANYDKLRVDMQNAAAALSKEQEAKVAVGKVEPTDEEKKRWAAEANRRKKELERQAEDLKKLRAQLTDDAAQAEVDKMAEGAARRRAQAALDFRREVADIIARQDELKKLQGGILTSEQESQFGGLIGSATSKRNGEFAAAVEDDKKAQEQAIDGFRSFAQEYERLLTDYQQKRAEAVRSGADAAGLVNADRAFEGQIKQLATSMNETTPMFKQWADGISLLANGAIEDGSRKVIDAAIAELQKQLMQATNALNALQVGGIEGNDANVYGQLTARVAALNKELDELRAEEDSGKQVGTDWKKTYSTLKKVADQFGEIGDQIGGAAGEAIKFAGSLATGMISAVSSVQALASGITSAGVAMSALEKASAVLAVISAVGTALSTIFGGAQKRREAARRERLRQEEGYWESINYELEKQLGLLDQLSGHEYFANQKKTIDGLKTAYENALKPTQDYISSTQNKIDALGRAADNAARTEGGINSSIISENSYRRLIYGLKEDLAPFDGIDLSNPESFEALKENEEIWKKLPKNIQDSIDRAIEFKDQLIELQKEADFRLLQTDSSEIRDFWMEMLSSGEDFSDNISEYFGDMMRKAAANSLLDGALGDAQKEFYDLYKKLADNDGVDGLDLTASEIEQLRAKWNEIGEMAQNQADNLNSVIGSIGSENDRTAEARGIESISQDSADELNGMMTLSVEHTRSIMEGTKILVQNSAQTLRHLAGIEANTARLNNIETDMSSMRSAIIDIRDKGITIK